MQWGPMGLLHMSNVTNPIWEEVTPQRASSKRKGMLSQCYSSPTVWVALGTAVFDLLCVETGPIVCLIARISRPAQGAGRGSSCGALVGIPIRWSSGPIATVAVPPLSCRVTGSAPQRKHELMRCTCCLLYSCCDQRQLDANYRRPMSIGSLSYTRSR